MTERLIAITNLMMAQDSQVSLGQLVREYQDGILRAPDHQRDAYAWSADKQESFIRRIQQNIPAIGCFLTYQLKQNDMAIGDGAIYLNDGLQRLTAVLHYYSFPEQFGRTKNEVEKELGHYMVTRQHRHYKNHMEAMVDFQAINQGTVLDAYEFGLGHLAYANNWSTLWKSEFDNWHNEMAREFSKLAKIPKKQLRRGEKVKKLHDYGLLIRFVDKDDGLTSFRDVTHTKPNPALFRNQQSVFQRLAKWINQTSSIEIRQSLKDTLNAATADMAIIHDAYHNTPFPNGTIKSASDLMPFSAALPLLEVGMYARVCGRKPIEFRDFAIKFMTAYNGKNYIARDGRYTHLRFNLLAQLREVCQIIGSDFYTGAHPKKQQRPKQERQLMRGYDNSHIRPFITNGDGPTFPELASINRSRGAKPVENPPAEYLFGGAE